MAPRGPASSNLEHENSVRDVLVSRGWIQKLREVFTCHLLKTVAMGQGLSFLICASAISSQYLATDFHVNTPMLQTFINYCLLCVTYSTVLALRKGDRNILQILRKSWWKYLLAALSDVEANYLLVKAYQFTTLTSIQMLDSSVVVVLMVLSWFVLKARYRALHYIAVVICLLGVGAMVAADVLSGRDQGSSSDMLLGDGLVLVSAVLFGISNVSQECSLKQGSLLEFPGMIGLFGTVISGIQCAILEHKDIAEIRWNWKIGLLFAAYGFVLFLFYSFLPTVMKLTSATAVNLSLLTADIFCIFFGVFLFHYTFSSIYVVSLVAILVGFIMFNAAPPPTSATVPPASHDGVDNVKSEPVEGCILEVDDGLDAQVTFQDWLKASGQEVVQSTKM